MPEDAKEAIGHGVRAKRSKSGAVSFDLLESEVPLMHRSSDSVAALAAAWPRRRRPSSILRNRSPQSFEHAAR